MTAERRQKLNVSWIVCQTNDELWIDLIKCKICRENVE